ncbi:class II fumarate hydratase [Halanaerobium praevalens]|uniref:Fumarate hydratase class II n=1 Tax=Halanaerobium praevalens (strain ATCC 33744 / DSM 2228 / GSL) TaxID=572479 RepID=E3DP83_HALPG|nr:class II fumarate hydratase [Halanaerobium praevalens]ADO76634.1 fumarase [Halanaerobium praevalens DSM 2228]
MNYRIEKDSLGEIKVKADKLYGAQTARAVNNFPIGKEKMPTKIIRAYGIVKKAAVLANFEQNLISETKRDYIIKATDELIKGDLDQHFPISLWQTGSGTQTNMNVNEVLANRISQLAGQKLGTKKPVHPNDDLNMSQSSNDTFPTAMAIAVVIKIEDFLLPTLVDLKVELEKKEEKYKDLVKVGRTHLMDATPITLGQEFGAFAAQLEEIIEILEDSLKYLKRLPIGGTAVGTGLNTKSGFDKKAIKYINLETDREFKTAINKAAGIAAHNSFVNLSGVLKTAASVLIKLANDTRWLASGPRAGIGELKIPKNEPGSSIMPGKVNPTQAEVLFQAAAQVIANDTAVNIGGASGNFQLNVAKPLIIYNILQSINLLVDSVNSYNTRCLKGIEADKEQIAAYLKKSLMLVTALNPIIGYDQAAEIAQKAFKEDITLKKSALRLGYLTEAEFEDYIQPQKMTKANLK